MKKFSAIMLAALLAGSGMLAAAEVDQRQADQQGRIAQGENSGELTNKEANHLHKDEKGIHKEVKAERKANGGHLTKGERKQVNHQENKVSRKIYRKKHNAKKVTK